MDRQRIIYLAIGALICVLVVVAFWIHAPQLPVSQNVSGSAGDMSPTRVPAPAGVTAPNEGAKNVSGNTAVPVGQVPVLPGSSASLRSFNIAVKNNTYTPNTVVVNQGDTVNLEVTAIDANYGFTQPDYGLNSTIKQGKTQTVQFQALQSGQFAFFCGACGGPSKGPVGHLVVVANQ